MILGELLERVYRAIHSDIVDGVATGGDATHITDSSLSSKYPANKFKNWIAFITRTTDGLSPQNKYGIISDYTNVGTATIPTVTATVDAGDEYAFCKPDVPLYTLIKLCNDAMKGLHRIPLVDTSITVAASMIRYPLPLALKGRKPDMIFFRHPTSFYRTPAPNYDVEPAASGSQATLVFQAQPFTTSPAPIFQLFDGWTMVIYYEGLHEALAVYNSPINETIQDELAVAACVERVMDWKVFPRQRKIDVANWQKAKEKFEEVKRDHPIELPTRDQQRIPIGIFNR